MSTTLWKTLLIFCFLGIAKPSWAENEAEDLHQLFADEWAQRLEDQPLTATFAGVEGYNHRLASVTPEAKARQAAQNQANLARLTAIDRAALSAADQVNYDIFAFML